MSHDSHRLREELSVKKGGTSPNAVQTLEKRREDKAPDMAYLADEVSVAVSVSTMHTVCVSVQDQWPWCTVQHAHALHEKRRPAEPTGMYDKG